MKLLCQGLVSWSSVAAAVTGGQQQIVLTDSTSSLVADAIIVAVALALGVIIGFPMFLDSETINRVTKYVARTTKVNLISYCKWLGHHHLPLATLDCTHRWKLVHLLILHYAIN